jgi:tRNA pseudouridine32 synthase / 23S rRNA pseudouridine746 synthase
MTGGLARAFAYQPPPDTGLQIVYQDEHFMAVDKPAGLLSVPGRGDDLQDCALRRVQLRFAQALLVHRLDEATSGLLLFALSPAVQKTLSAAFETRQIQKIYHARVHGADLPDSGIIDASIAVDWPNRPLRKIDTEAGQSATTHFQTLSKNELLAQSLCRLEPQTGRTHQLRVHLQHIGHPIVGDRLYGKLNDDAPRLMLHASRLKFAHPADADKLIELNSPPPF